ncbi:MAG: hypothetical protein R2942_12405 [Ignavibacteria bacterium]
MNISDHHIIVEKSARYCTNLPDEKKINYTWIVIHGYAQLAKDFIKNLNSCPHRILWSLLPKVFQNSVQREQSQASWMTEGRQG